MKQLTESEKNQNKSSTAILKFILDFLSCYEINNLPDILLNKVLDNDMDFIKLLKDRFNYDDFIMRLYSDFLVNRKDLKQDFTPPSFCKLIRKIVEERFDCDNRKVNTVYDCCCGTGALTIEFSKINKKCIFYMHELDSNVIPFLLLNLLINEINADVIHGNVLTKEIYNVYRIRNGILEKINSDNYIIPICDVAISNPPFGIRFKTDEDFKEFGGYKQSSVADAMFFIRCLQQINNKGIAMIIMGPGFSFYGNQYVNFRKYLIESNILDSIVRLPGNSFINTQIKVDLYVFDKMKSNNKFAFIYNAESNYSKNVFTVYKNGTYGGKAHENRVYYKKLDGLDDGNIELLIYAVNYHESILRNHLYLCDMKDIEEHEYNFNQLINENVPVETEIEKYMREHPDQRCFLKKK